MILFSLSYPASFIQSCKNSILKTNQSVFALAQIIRLATLLISHCTEAINQDSHKKGKIIHVLDYDLTSKIDASMKSLKALFQIDPDSRELLEGTARRLAYTVLAIHLIFHFTATLVWPRVFSPGLWLTTLFLLFLTAVTQLLMRRGFYLNSQMLWLGGLGSIILHAYAVYSQPEILTLLVFLPLMAICLRLYSLVGARFAQRMERTNPRLHLCWFSKLPRVIQRPPLSHRYSQYGYLHSNLCDWIFIARHCPGDFARSRTQGGEFLP
jgi:hypothetical protein